MSRYIAFLRAINVGNGRTIDMKSLRQIFASLGFSNAETIIASGNIIFGTPSKNVKALEKKIGKRLQEELGYEGATFVRTSAQLIKIADYSPFSRSKITTAAEFNIIFLSATLGKRLRQKLADLKTDTNEFHTHGREIYWLRRKERGKSRFSPIPLEKVWGKRFTIRSSKTIHRIALKISGSKRD